jgi:hypothetical protein
MSHPSGSCASSCAKSSVYAGIPDLLTWLTHRRLGELQACDLR